MRGRFVVSLLLIPIIVIFALSDKILIGIHQDPTISKIAQVYVCVMLPGCWAMSQFDAARKYLIAQQKQNLPVYVQIVTTVFHFIWCYLFITVWKLNVVGAALSLNITYILNWLLLDLYIHFSGCCPKTWVTPNKHAFENVWEYLKIGISGALMLCFEWWAFELLAIFSGYISVAALAAEVVIINIVSFIFMLPLGISYSASCLVGNYIGEKNIKLAKRFANLTIAFNVICTVVVIIIFATLRTGISRLFTTEKDVVEIIDQVLWIICIYIFFDTIHGVQSGIIRGLGRQFYGSIYTLICYYIFGMPLALIFAFPLGWGVAGLWAGFTIACIVLDIGFAFIITCCNWNEIAEKSHAKMEEEERKRIAAIENNPNLGREEKDLIERTPNRSRAVLKEAIDDVDKSIHRSRQY
jgi:MATE family multidrug resistance protein